MVRQTSTTDIRWLVNRARLADPQSLDRLARLVYARLGQRLSYLTFDKELAADLAQETLLEMIESLQSLRKAESFWPWILQILSSKAKQHFREHQRLPSVRLSALAENQMENAFGDDSGDAGARLIRREQRQLIIDAISQLQGRSRAIVCMRCFGEMPYSQISRTVGCSESAVRTSFLRARRKLKNLLSKELSNVTTSAG
jgi:RNA polymerase sigma-70 factor (ECF subfamily)